MRLTQAAAIAAVLTFWATTVPASALAANAANTKATFSVVNINIKPKALRAKGSVVAPTDVSARKRKGRFVRHARGQSYAAASSSDFCGDRYCGQGGSYVSGVTGSVRSVIRAGRGMAKAAVRGGVGLVARAEAHLGATAAQLGLPRSQWCSDFMNKITGGGTGSRLARSWAGVGTPAPRGCVGCVAVLARGRSIISGHVGVVKGWFRGNPVIVSGNHNRRVGVGEYPASRIVALRWV